jgi:hypothetical protein
MKYCAVCRDQIKETYFMYQDNFLQLKFFNEMDGSDNIFCSSHCAGQALMLEEADNENFKKEEEERLGLTLDDDLSYTKEVQE